MVQSLKWYWEEMRKVFNDDLHMIDHTQKVFDYTQQIAEDQPGLTSEEKRLIAIIAIMHDIGILEAEKKYRSRSGKYQHIEGPPVVRKIMSKAEESLSAIERVAYIVGNHHHFSKADKIDFQILIEADMLVNLQNETIQPQKLSAFIDRFFKTLKGRELARKLYLKK